MSVVFASTAKYTGDSGSDIDNVSAGGFVVIMRPTTASFGALQSMMIKGTGAANPSLQFDTSGVLTLVVSRATTNLFATAAITAFPSVQADTWLMLAGRYDAAGTSSDQQLWAARIGNALREPSPYTLQQLGTGAQVDDSAGTIFVGNNNGGGRPTTCPIFAAAMFNRYPNYTALSRVARELLVVGRRPVFNSAVARAYRFDRGSGTLVCLKTQNALTPSGTITYADNPARTYAGALRFFPGAEFAFPVPEGPVTPDWVRLGQRALRTAATALLDARRVRALLQRAQLEGLARFTPGGTQGTGASTSTGGATSTGGRVRHLSLLRLNRRRR